MTDTNHDQAAAKTRGGAGAFGRLLKLLSGAEEVVCYGLLGVLVVVTSLQVFTRYVLNAPFTWTEEVARMLFTWIVFLGAALIVKRGSHISIDFVAKALPPVPQRVVLAVSRLITLAIVITLAVKGAQLLQITGVSASPALNIPWVYVYAAFPLGMTLMAVRYGQSLVRLLRSPIPHGTGQEAAATSPDPPS